MNNDRPRRRRRAKTRQEVSMNLPTEPGPEQAVIDAERAGRWMPAEELREAALAATKQGQDLTLNLNGIDHLEASALQVLLAADAEQRQQGRHLVLSNASPGLRQWLEYSGAAERFFGDGAERQ